MIFDAFVILTTILLGGLLLFPVKVRFLFAGKRNEGKFEVRLFRKKIYAFGSEKISEEDADSDLKLPEDFEELASKKDDFDSENPWKESLSEEKTTRPLDAGENCSPPSFEKKSDSAAEKNTSATKKKVDKEKKTKRRKAKKENSDREFLTLIVEPVFEKKILKGVFRLGRSFFRLFHCRFEPTVVEGIRLNEDYERMGYVVGGLNAMSGIVPFFENWIFLADWTGEKPLRIEGGFVASFSIARILGFIFISAKTIAELTMYYFWNRRRYRKNPESVRLVFWRRWIVRFLSSP